MNPDSKFKIEVIKIVKELRKFIHWNADHYKNSDCKEEVIIIKKHLLWQKLT